MPDKKHEAETIGGKTMVHTVQTALRLAQQSHNDC